MADATSTVTIDTGEWNYIDSSGISHPVTNAQTFTMLVSDDGTADVQYNFIVGQSVVTDDGYTLEFQPRTNINNQVSQLETLTDAGQGSAFTGLRGEMSIKCSSDGVVQHWKPVSVTPSDADFGSAGTIAASWEDQFGNTMSWTAGTTVGQAS